MVDLALMRDVAVDPARRLARAALAHAPDGSGTKVAAIVGCHIGTPEQADRDLEPLRRTGSPLVVEIGPMPYVTVNSFLDPGYPRGALNYWKSSFLCDLGDTAIETIVDAFRSCASPGSSFVLENLHGQVTRVPVEATAVPHRQR
jgi:hypothetical protein